MHTYNAYIYIIKFKIFIEISLLVVIKLFNNVFDVRNKTFFARYWYTIFVIYRYVLLGINLETILFINNDISVASSKNKF